MAEEDTEEKKSRSGLIKYALFAFGGIALVGIGLGVGYLVFASGQPDPSEEIEAIIERKLEEAEAAKEAENDNSSPSKVAKDTPVSEQFMTIYHEFPGTFTTNLMNSRKMLQVGVGVSTQYDETIMERVESHQLALRSVVLGIMSEYSETDIQGREGRQRLAEALRDGINDKLVELEDFGGVAEVHFTSFVLQ